MTTKHTTAPWILHKLSGEIRTQDNLKVITDINYRLRDGCGEANAKLIAAAPDLLAALIACDEAMEYISEYDIPLTLQQQVKDAIAKATGELK